MLFTITTTHAPATDLGFLLHKNPGRAEPQEIELSFGRALVFWTEASDGKATARLHVGTDRPSGHTGKNGQEAYVSDRPYAAGSYLPTAIQKAFGTAIGGRCDAKPELAAGRLPLVLEATPVACRGSMSATELFGPLGWEVEDTALPLDPAFPEWGSMHHRIRLTGTMRLADALRHVCVLLPVLDGRKHHFVDDGEVDKLLRLGEGWLTGHPHSRYITRRFTGFRHLAQAAAQRLQEEAGVVGPQEDDAAGPTESPHERPRDLQEARIAAAVAALRRVGVRRVADIGCGEGDLIAALLADRHFERVVGVDPSVQALARAVRRLGYERMGTMGRERLELLQGSATYPDSRLAQCDGYALLEVIEHVDPWCLAALERAVFGVAHRPSVVMTTPNREWNALIPALDGGGMRHRDHRFEWSRGEFREWARGVCERHGYDFEWMGVGESDNQVGPPTQGGVFVPRGQ